MTLGCSSRAHEDGYAAFVPLSRQSVGVLRALNLLTGNGRLVFPGANDKQKPMSNNTILFALYRLGYKGRMTGHGFRGLASTILHENGFEDEHVELQLAHQKRNKVAAAYNHAKYLNQRKTMMQWWADYLDAQLAKGRQGTIGIRVDQFAGPGVAPNHRKSPDRISSRSRRVHALYGPLSDFGLDPSNCARSQPDGCRKLLFPDQIIDARFREARDRFHLW